MRIELTNDIYTRCGGSFYGVERTLALLKLECEIGIDYLDFASVNDAMFFKLSI